MSDTLAPAIPIRPTTRYGDSRARHGVCRLLADTTPIAADEAGTHIAEIAARTGRRLDRARTVTAEVTDNAHRMPTARVDANGTVLLAGHGPDGPGVLDQVNTRDATEDVRAERHPGGRPAAAPPSALPRPGRADGREGGLPGNQDKEGRSP